MASNDNISTIPEATAPAAYAKPQMCQEDRHTAYKSLISDIAESLSEDDLRKIVWHHKEDLPAALERSCKALEVLNHLDEKRKFSEWKVESLRKLLATIKRNDLEEKVVNFQHQYPQTERHHSMPVHASNPHTSIESRSNTYSAGTNFNPQAAIANTVHPRQETVIDSNIISPGFDMHGLSHSVMVPSPAMPQRVSHEPMSAPVVEGQHVFDFQNTTDQQYKFLSSGTNTPGSVSSLSRYMYSQHPVSGSHHSSRHASSERFVQPANNSHSSLHSGDSIYLCQVGHHLQTASGHNTPWYRSSSSLPPLANRDTESRLHFNHGSFMTMPERAMTADHERRFARRNTVPTPLCIGCSDRQDELQYYIEKGIDPRLVSPYHTGHHPSQPGIPPENMQHHLENHSRSHTFSHSQPSYYGAYSNMVYRYPQQSSQGKIAPYDPRLELNFHQEQTMQRAWGSSETHSEHSSLNVPTYNHTSNRTPSHIQHAAQKVEGATNVEDDHHFVSDKKRSNSSHHTSSNRHDTVQSQHYAYDSDDHSDDTNPAAEMLVYADEKQWQVKEDDSSNHSRVVFRANKKKSSNQAKRYSLQPQNKSRRNSLLNKRLSSGAVMDDQHMQSKPSEDTLIGSPHSHLSQSPRSNRTGSFSNSMEDKSGAATIQKPSYHSKRSVSSLVTSKKQRTKPAFLFSRPRLIKQHQELLWQVKRDKLNKMIYKHKANKYISCSDKIELESDHSGPHPKVTLNLCPYGAEEDQNENVTLKIVIEQSKKTGAGCLHSSTKVEVCVCAYDMEKDAVIGEEYRVQESVRSSFFFVKGFISHHELKKSHSEYIAIRAKAKLILPAAFTSVQ